MGADKEVNQMADERKTAREYWEQHITTSEGILRIAGEPHCRYADIFSQMDLEEFLARIEYLGYQLGWLEEEDVEVTPTPDGDSWAFIEAGSTYGSQRAWYQVTGGVLILRDEGDHDNLAGNDACLDFEGLTLEQAYAKADSLDSEPVGHEYDGCHACKWSIEVRVVDDPANYGAEFLTYQEPPEAAQLRELIRAFLQKKASFAELRAALAD